jgi:hypothetical protein
VGRERRAIVRSGADEHDGDESHAPGRERNQNGGHVDHQSGIIVVSLP